MLIQGTHRTYMGSDTFIAAFVRDDEGRKDLSDADIDGVISLGKGRDVLTVPVSGNEYGRISFVVTAEQAQQNLRPGVYELRVLADGEVIYLANLEVV